MEEEKIPEQPSQEEFPKAEIFSAVARKVGSGLKVFYYICLAVTVSAIVLGIILASEHAIKEWTKGETLLFFGIVALYAFLSVGLFWNVEELFKNMADEKSPFCERAGHYINKTAFYIFALSILPSLVGMVVLGIMQTSYGIVSSLKFEFGYSGVISGIITLFLSMVFDYGYELQQKVNGKEE